MRRLPAPRRHPQARRGAHQHDVGALTGGPCRRLHGARGGVEITRGLFERGPHDGRGRDDGRVALRRRDLVAVIERACSTVTEGGALGLAWGGAMQARERLGTGQPCTCRLVMQTGGGVVPLGEVGGVQRLLERSLLQGKLGATQRRVGPRHGGARGRATPPPAPRAPRPWPSCPPSTSSRRMTASAPPSPRGRWRRKADSARRSMRSARAS